MNPQNTQSTTATRQAIRRVRWLFACVVVVAGVFWVRTFYLQVIRYDYYSKAALSVHQKQYQIPATRGLIEAHSGDQTVPIVLNQKLYTIYVDPVMVKDVDDVATALTRTLGGAQSDYEAKVRTKDTRYVIIAKKVDAAKKNAILRHKYPGVGAVEISYRTYPNKALASQLLGFVNDEGKGTYGIEQALNSQLAGKPGELKAVTDVNGVPLAANTENIQVAPTAGEQVVLTIDMAMQQQVEAILQQGLKDAKSNSGSALIMDPTTGAIKAMANWPTYDPGDFANVEDPSVFQNANVSSPLEVGSIMKPLTAAAALDKGVVRADTSYDDPAQWTVDDYKITNIEEDGGAGRRNIADILNLSLNTGATWLLMQLGDPGGRDITPKGRSIWHDYMTDHFRLGQKTGIEQGYEAVGTIPDPDKGYARDLTYANTSFGQGMSATPIQMAAAFSAVINGGTYYRPFLVEQTMDASGKKTVTQPQVLRNNVVSAKVSNEMRSLLEYVVENHHFKPSFDQNKFAVGGKTGTAQIADPHGAGGYREHDFNGTYLGFVGGDKAEYVIMVRVNEPKIAGYAGSQAAQPIFGTLSHMLIDNYGVTPKGQ
ncbi:MAG TPA: penicillin-binding protein 2 [Candidatus Saccharimonadales bacterium]|nr:penicillin-binding protein 2 [Candidatus Saccharimonadales bacterium]